MVPNSWVSCHLGDFMEFKNGLNADKSQYGYGLKFVNVMDVFGNDILTEDKIIGRVNVAESQLESNLLKFGDVLFNRTSETFDEIAMSAVYLDDKPAVFGGFVIRARPSNGILSPAYSVYLFQSSKFRNQVIKLGQGAVRANIGQKDLAKVKVSLPPLPEQKKIAQILSTWDKAITTTEQLLANSQKQKKALMQQLLTSKKRLLDDNGVRFSGEWKKIKFNKLIKEVKKEKVDNPNSIELLTVRLHYKGVVRTGKFPNATERGRPYFKRYAGELIIGRQNLHNGGIAIVSEECSGLIASNAISSFEVKKSSNINFILSIMSTDRFRFTVDSLAGGTGQKEIGVKDLLSLSVIAPDLEEQQKIAAVLTSADEEIDRLQQKVDALKQEKKALMQQLLTGKRRVKP